MRKYILWRQGGKDRLMTELAAQLIELFRQLSVEQKQMMVLSAALSYSASDQESSAAVEDSTSAHIE